VTNAAPLADLLSRADVPVVSPSGEAQRSYGPRLRGQETDRVLRPRQMPVRLQAGLRSDWRRDESADVALDVRTA